LFHIPIQESWAQKMNAVTGLPVFSSLMGFVMGVAGSVLIYELFIRANPVALWWFGRKKDTTQKKPVEQQ
jgi:hypothetical protein